MESKPIKFTFDLGSEELTEGFLTLTSTDISFTIEEQDPKKYQFGKHTKVTSNEKPELVLQLNEEEKVKIVTEEEFEDLYSKLKEFLKEEEEEEEEKEEEEKEKEEEEEEKKEEEEEEKEKEKEKEKEPKKKEGWYNIEFQLEKNNFEGFLKLEETFLNINIENQKEKVEKKIFSIGKETKFNKRSGKKCVLNLQQQTIIEIVFEEKKFASKFEKDMKAEIDKYNNSFKKREEEKKRAEEKKKLEKQREIEEEKKKRRKKKN